jgi:hypothetical protein
MSTPHRRSTPARIWTMQRESGPRERTGRGPGASAAPPRCSRPHRLQPSDLSLLLLIVPPTGAVAPVHRGTTGRPAERPGRRRELRPAKAKPEARSAVTRGYLQDPLSAAVPAQSVLERAREGSGGRPSSRQTGASELRASRGTGSSGPPSKTGPLATSRARRSPTGALRFARRWSRRPRAYADVFVPSHCCCMPVGA